MRRFFCYVIPFSLVFFSSCFSSRKTISEPKILIADPVITTLDTTTYIEKAKAPQVDLLVEKAWTEDTLKIEQFPDSLSADTLKNYPEEVVQSGEPDTDLIADTSLRIDTLCIIGTGDIMPGTNYPDASYLPPGNNCSSLFRPVKEILQGADVTFGNLEGVFCSEGGKAKQCRDPKVCYVFRMPDSYLDCILDAGYDVLSVANNHVNDFGLEGRISTAKHLKSAGIPFAGFQTVPSTIFEKDGITYGFAAFAPHTGTMNLKDYSGAAKIVAGLDSLCDIVIVSFHGGAEGRDYQHVPCADEEYLGYNRGNVCKFAHAVVDAGADVIFGHGPHVTRALELYKGRLIAYSLGNFCTYARFNLSGPNGLAPILKVYTTVRGEFTGGEIIPVYQAGEGGPRIDPQGRVITKLRELSEADFPDSQLQITEEGVLSVKN